MGKGTLIDVPEIGYRTWLISEGYFDETGKFHHNDDSKLEKEIGNLFPYNSERDHIIHHR